MREFELKEYNVFEMFINQWALVTAGTSDSFNTCTIGWGSLGTIWCGFKDTKPIVTIYVRPDRYTYEFLKHNEQFTVSFFPKEYKKALGYLGSHSGRDGDKVKVSGLTPKPIHQSITFEEANLTFVCKKIYDAPFEWERMSDDVKKVYEDMKVDTLHCMFIGEILDVEDKR